MNKSIRLKLIKEKEKCQGCKNGFEDRDLCVHHKDGNKKNNNLNNLVILCKSCHRNAHHNKKFFSKTKSQINKQISQLKIERDYIDVKIKLLEDSLIGNPKQEVLMYMGGK